MEMKPATNLTDAFNLCDPGEPLAAGDLRYVDLVGGRGGGDAALTHCRRRILRSESPLVQLVLGHRGCGKTTELRRLGTGLAEAGFFVIEVDVEADVDLEDVGPVEVLLSVLHHLEVGLRAARVRLPRKTVDDFVTWLGEVALELPLRRDLETELWSEVGGGRRPPLFARLLSRLTGLVKTGGAPKLELRQRLESHLPQLMHRGGRLINAARAAVERAGQSDLVLIVDHLDRVALKQCAPGRSSHEALFVSRGALLKEFGCHTVLTAPFSLLFSTRLADLRTLFPVQHVLPVVRIAERASRRPWPQGRLLLQQLLSRRVDLKLLEDGVAEIMIAASGGHPGLLLTLVRQALDFCDQAPVTFDAASKAVRRLIDDFWCLIPEEQLELLAKVYRDQKVKNDATHQRLVSDLVVIQYQSDATWYDVHPMVVEQAEFQQTFKSLAKAKPGAKAGPQPVKP